MRTNIEIDDRLMSQAMKASEATTKKAVVEEALQLMVDIRGQQEIRKLFGIGGLDPAYDYKAIRVSDTWDNASLTRAKKAPLPRRSAGEGKRGLRKQAA